MEKLKCIFGTQTVKTSESFAGSPLLWILPPLDSPPLDPPLDTLVVEAKRTQAVFHIGAGGGDTDKEQDKGLSQLTRH